MTLPKKDYVRRLNILKGQIEGLRKMIETKPDDCFGILTQVKAVKKGLDRISEDLLKNRLKECLTGKSGASEEELDTLLKLLSDA